LFLGEGL